MKNRLQSPLSWRLALIAAIALALRVYDIGRPFYANDPAELPLYASMTYPHSMAEVYNAFAFGHGAGALLLGYAILWIYGALGIHVTEFAWNLPYALAGSITVVLVYMFLSQRQSKSSAFTASLFLAVYPLHVGFSRSAGFGHVSIGLLFQLTTIILFHAYYSKPSAAKALAASLSLAMVFLFDLFFPFILPVLLYIGLISQAEKDALASARKALKMIFRAEFIIPVIVLLIQLSWLMKDSGSLAYSISKPDAKFGMHLKSFSINMLFFLGPSMLLTCLFSAVYGTWLALKKDADSMFLAWSVSYCLPFAFMLDRCATNYVLFPTAPLIVLAGIMLGRLNESKGNLRTLSQTATALLCLILLANTLDSVYRIPAIAVRELPKGVYCTEFYDSCYWTPCEYWYAGIIYPQDEGYKAASYWIRKNTKDTTVVFSDAYGRQGRRRNLLYYLHRRLIGINIGARQSMLDAFSAEKSRLDIVLVRPANEEYLNGLDRFYKTLVIESDGNPVLFVFTSVKYYDLPLTVDAGGYNRLYDMYLTQASQVEDADWGGLSANNGG